MGDFHAGFHRVSRSDGSLLGRALVLTVRAVRLMARIKPSGVTIRVWRQLTEAEKAGALKLCQQPDELAHRLRQLKAAAANRPPPAVPLSAASASSSRDAGAVAAPKAKMPGSKRVPLSGILSGWTREDRCTAAGRKYPVYYSPDGSQYFSKVAAERAAMA